MHETHFEMVQEKNAHTHIDKANEANCLQLFSWLVYEFPCFILSIFLYVWKNS